MTTPPTLSVIEPIGWPTQRWLFCRQALRQRARRWAGWTAMGLLLTNIGSNDPVATTLGLMGLAVMPVFAASQAGPVAWLLATLVYGGLVSLLLRALRPVLWSATWEDSVRALPLPLAHLRRSDRLVLGVALAPVVVGWGTGWAVWAAHAPDTRWAAAAGLVFALGGAYGAGGRLLRAWRNPTRPQPASARPAGAAATPPRPSTPLRTWRALVWLALWQGPAWRTGRWLAGGAALLLAGGGCALFAWPLQLPWTLAVLSLACQVWMTRAQALADEELAPLLARAANHFPLASGQLQRWQQAAVLLPGWALICLLTAGAGWAAPAGLLRPAVLCAWGLCLLGTSGVSLRWPPAEVSNRSARWWLFSVLLLALSSEVLV